MENFKILLFLCARFLANFTAIESKSIGNPVLRLFATHSEPFFYHDKQKEIIKGFEFQLIKTIAEKLNFTLSHQSTFNQMETDISIGRLPLGHSSNDSASFSIPYFEDDWTWCVRNAGYYPLYLNLFLLAKPECWIGIVFGFGYVTGYILYIFIQFDEKFKYRNFRDWHYTTWLISLPAVIGVNQTFKPLYGPLRIFYGFMLLIGVILSLFLLTFGMARAKNLVPMYQVSTVAEILDNEYRLFGSRECLEMIKYDERVISQSQFHFPIKIFVFLFQFAQKEIEAFNVCENIDECLKRLKSAVNFDWAISASRNNILNSAAYSSLNFHCFDRSQSIRIYLIALEMRKEFGMRAKIDKIIRNLFESGILLKWYDENLRKRNYETAYIAPDHFTMEHYQIAFTFILGFGWTMSVATFSMEIITFKKLGQKRNHKIWIYFEYFVDGQRHYMNNLIERLSRK